MPTYRSLSLNELKLFQKEFAEYLAVNGIDADLWREIKETDQEKVDGIIDTFSDVVYNSVLHKMEYIEFATENDIKYFHYGKEKAQLIGLESDDVSFLNPQEVLKAIENKRASIKSYRTSKSYTKKREIELFAMLKNGCQPSDGSMFKLLSSIV